MGSSIFVLAYEVFRFGIWDLVLRPGIKPGPPALEAQSLSYWTTREVPEFYNMTISNPGC